MARRNWTRFLILIWPLWFLAGGCASQSPDPWQGIEVSTDPAPEPLSLPVWPDPVFFDAETVTFDLDGARTLTEFQVTAQTNTELAAELAKQVNQLQTASQALTEAGQAQRVVADLRSEILVEERRQHAWEKAGLYGPIILIIGGAAVQ